VLVLGYSYGYSKPAPGPHRRALTAAEFFVLLLSFVLLARDRDFEARGSGADGARRLRPGLRRHPAFVARSANAFAITGRHIRSALLRPDDAVARNDDAIWLAPLACPTARSATVDEFRFAMSE